MAENNQSAAPQDELDLLYLLERLIAFLKKYGRLLLIFCIVGIIAGWLIFISLPKTYSTDVIVHSSILTNSEEIAIINNWNELLKRGERKALAAKWDCDPAMLTGLVSITAAEIEKVTAQNSVGFTIEMRVVDTSISDALSRSVVYGLENTDYVRQRIAVKRNNLVQLIDEVKIGIARLDSAKTGAGLDIAGKNTKSSPLVLGLSNVEVITLREKLAAYQEELQFVNAIQVLQVMKFAQAVSPRKGVLMFGGAFLGLGIALALALFQVIRRKLKERSRAGAAV